MRATVAVVIILCLRAAAAQQINWRVPFDASKNEVDASLRPAAAPAAAADPNATASPAEPDADPTEKEILPTLSILGVTVLQGAKRARGNKPPVCPGGGRARRVKGELCCDCRSFSVRRPQNVTDAPDPAPADGGGGGAATAAAAAGDGTVAPAAPGFSTGSNLNRIKYQGGPVMSAAARVHIVWYGTWADTQKQIIRDLITGLSGSDLQTIQTTYGDTLGNFIKPTHTLGSEYAYTTNSAGTTLTDSNVWTLISTRVQASSLPLSVNDVYMLLTGPDIMQGTSTSGFCNAYCGWHSYGTLSNTKLKISWVGNAASKCPNGCGAVKPSVNGDPGADGMASVIAHELWEAESDPLLNAWFDTTGQENADKCAWQFGSTYLTSNNAKYNVQLGTRKFLLQQNWVNAMGGNCSLNGTSLLSNWVATPNALYLDRQTPACPPAAAMRQFQVQTRAPSDVRYALTCPPMADTSKIGVGARYTTAAAPNGAGSTYYLDRHNVACPSGSVLQKFHLLQATASTIQYEFWCAPITGTLSCTTASTTFAADGGGSVLYLDRHNINCPVGKYIQRFQYTRNAPTNNQIRYDYTCCGL